MSKDFVVEPLPARGMGAALGAVCGLALGAIVGPVGIVCGVGVGAAVGLLAAQVIAREESRRDARTRELDDTIGITSGSLGAPPDSLIPPRNDENAAWAAEWLTPPPPSTCAG